MKLIYSLKPNRREHLLILSILIYSFVGVLKYYIPIVLCNILILYGALMFIFTLLSNVKRTPLTGLTGFLYSFLLIWTLCLTFHMFFIADVRSTFTVYNGITTWILAYFSSPFFLPNLMPLIILMFPRNYKFDFSYLWRVMWLMCILYLCYFPFSFWSMTHYNWSMDTEGLEWGEKGTYGDFITNSTIGISSLAPVVIMIYFKKYITSYKWNRFVIAYVGSIIISAFLARRGGLAMSVLYIVLVWIMYSLYDKSVSKIKLIVMATFVTAIVFVLFNNMSDTLFATLTERGLDDTREGVEESFYSDMNTIQDWIFGRGWFGQYWEPVFSKYRSSIETGYLALILRGGFIYLIPYVAILFLSFYNGYFKSNNLFCKSFALLCLMQIVSLYPYGWPAFNFFHFFIWIGVWICNNKYYRNISDSMIKSTIFK